VPPGASAKQITEAYRKLAARYHPDKHQGNELEELAAEKLTALNAAHDVLSNPTRRAAYDADRRRINMVGGPAGRSPGSRPPVSAARTVRGLMLLVLLVLAIPFVLRFVRSPRGLALIAAVLFIAWFGPRIVRYFRNR